MFTEAIGFNRQQVSKSLKFPSLEEIEKAEKAEFERKKANCLQSLQNL